MKFNRNEHSRFIQWLDRAAEKNPLLWLPCVLLITLAMAGEHIAEYIKIVYLHRNTEKVVNERPHIERKPFALRVLAMSLVVALGFMLMPDLSGIISVNVFASNTYVIDNLVCEIVDNNKIVINGINDTNQLNVNGGEVVIPSQFSINDNSYTVTEIADNAFSNLTYINALIIPNNILKIGNNILPEKILNMDEEHCFFHIFCNSDSYAYTYVKEKQYPEYVIILMDSNDFLPINVFKSDRILEIFGSTTNYEYLITSERPYKIMLENFNDDLAFKCGITSWQALTFEASNLVDIFKDEHDFYLTYLCEILQNKFNNIKSIPSETSDMLSIIHDTIKLLDKCGIDYKSSSSLTPAQVEQLKSEIDSSDLIKKFDSSLIKPLKDILKAGKRASEIFNIVCNMYCLSCISEETVEFLNIMKQNTTNESLIWAINEVIISTKNLPALLAREIFSYEMESFVKKALNGIVDDLIEKNPACMALKLVRDGTQFIVNSVFSTDDIVKQYYTLKYFVELEDVIKKSCRQVENNFRQSRTEKNADVFLAGIDVYFQAMDYGYNCMDKMAKIVYESSLMGWNADKYNSFHNSVSESKRLINNEYESYGYIYGYISTFYYSEYSKHISVESLAFARESVEWGLNDKYFYGYSCSITPSNADNKEIIYTTSDSTVAEIDNGIAKVNGLGSCVITATSVDNPKAFDTLNVTVVEGSGADSSLDEILPSYEDDYEYTISNGEVTITKYKGTDTNVVIPKTIKGKPVKYIYASSGVGDTYYGAFTNNQNIISVIIPDSITSIGNYIFYGCTSLTDITIPNSVTSIGKEAFYGCTRLTDITIPDSVTSIDGWAFNDCTSLTSIALSNNVTSIEWGAFAGCTSLTSINIPDSVISIDGSCFENCTNLTKITIPDSVTSIGVGCFKNCTSLTSITIPDSVTSIDEFTFYGCTNLTNIIIPNSVTSIDDWAFRDCTSLVSITIPNSVISIGGWAFRDCTSLTSITIPDSVASIDYDAFHGCTSLTSITIPDSVISLGRWSFAGFTNLTSITLPNSVTSIGDYAFSGCKSLTNITIPDNVTSIGQYAFRGCTSLVNIAIPDSVISINNHAFEDCTTLESITIPDSVTSIGNDAFLGCKGLTSLTIPDSVTSLGSCYFHNFTNLTSITLPNSVTSIDNYDFSGCTSLTNIKIPNSVIYIGDYAFRDCTDLENITIPDNVISIGTGAFRGCTSLTNIKIPKNVTSIGSWAFEDCTTICGYKNSYAESYANSYKIPFVYLDYVPTDKILDIIESANENTTLTINISKYGTDLTAEEVSAAKDKNLTLVINGNNFSWRTKAADLPNTAVDFKLISPNGSVDKSQFNDSYKNRSFDIKTVNPSGAKLTYNVGTENNGYCANIFKVENGNFMPILSDLVDNGQITFIPSDNSTYCIVISTDSNPIGTEELFKTTPVVNTVLDSLSVNGVMINGFSPDKTDYTYSVSYANWLSDSSRIYSISASSNNSANVTINDNDFILNSDNYDTATSKDVTITVSSDSGEQTVYTVKFVVEACPHANRIENISKEPTCIELGEKETACSVCGKSFGVENISALGHDFDNGTTIYEPDCVNMGTVQYQCSRCDESFIRTIPALGHRWGEVTVDTATTCTTDGISSRHCEVCGARSYETLIPASGHSFSAWTKINDTTYERVCAICGTTETKIVTSTDHDHIFNGTIDIITPATCQAVGSQNVHCSVEGCTEFVTEETAKIAHTPAEAVVVNATCTTAGNSATYCAVCNTKLSETELPATGHRFSNYTDTATCTLPGIRTAVCDNGCGTSDSIPTPAKGHCYDDWHKDDRGHWHECLMCGSMTDIISHSENDGIITIQPTETTDGVKTYSCTECGYVMRTETIKKPVLPIPDHTVHTFGTKWFNDSISHWHECTVCGEHSDTAYHNESHSEVTIQPTATTFGTRTYYCSVCGYAVRTETIPQTDNPNPPYPVNPTPSYPTITYPTNSGTQTANEPYIYGENSKVGWDAIISEINFATDSSTVRVNMNGITELPQDVVSHIQNRNINLELNMGSAVWTINGLDVTNPKTVNMRVSERSNKIPDSVMDSLYSELTAKQLRLYHSGNFGFTAKLALNVGKKYNGYYATLYYYNTKTKQLEYSGQSYVSGGGIAEFEFVHASYYAIGFSSEPIFDDVSSGAGVVDFGTLVDVDSPVTNGVRIPQVVIPRGFKLSNKKRKYRILKKRRLDDLVFVF